MVKCDIHMTVFWGRCCCAICPSQPGGSVRPPQVQQAIRTAGRSSHSALKPATGYTRHLVVRRQSKPINHRRPLTQKESLPGNFCNSTQSLSCVCVCVGLLPSIVSLLKSQIRLALECFPWISPPFLPSSDILNF